MTTRRRYREDPAVLDVEARTPAAGARLPRGWVQAATAVVRHLHATHVIRPAGPALERAPDGATRPVRVWEAVPVDDDQDTLADAATAA